MQVVGQAASLLAESACWRLVGLLFERPRPGWHEEVRALALEVGSERLTAAVDAAREADEGTYLAILGPGGAVSPREVAYRNMGDPGKILSELRGFYEAFGFDPRAEDPPDHVAVEAGFVGFAKIKEAYAAARGDSAGERMAREAAQVFIERHLGGFAGDLAERLIGMPDYLERAAAVLRELSPCPTPAQPVLRVLGQEAMKAEEDEFPCGGDCSGPVSPVTNPDRA